MRLHPPKGPVERFALRSTGALVAVVVVAVGFALTAALVRGEWAPLRQLDTTLSRALTGWVGGNGVLENVLVGITDLGGTPMLVWLLVVGVAWLLLRRQPRLAVYVAVSAAGAMILNSVVKELVARLRPEVDGQFYAVAGWSFPSGHSMSSFVFYGVLALVFAPLLHGAPRRLFITAVALLVVAIGFTRMALGAHYLTDVISGWLLGALWLASTTVAFHRWRQEAHIPETGALPGDVAADDAADLRPVPEHHPPGLPHPWRKLGVLVTGWVLLVGVMFWLGTLLTAGPRPPAIDLAVTAWMVEHHNPHVTAVLELLGELGSTGVIITGALVVGPLAIAITRSWQPLAFLGLALAGEITLFLTMTTLVDRRRPDISQLNPDLPPTSSFPSGHVAATITLLTATALLAHAVTTRWWRWVPTALAVTVVTLVAVQRLYSGVHHLTDVAGSLVLALTWTFLTWRVICPHGVESAPRPSTAPARTVEYAERGR
ncbi:phosphatase PAP2 family protein [Actinokineospora sp. 24-640]